jgi:hypothetical protein
VWSATKHIPGWQEQADSEKLYEMAYHNGAVILEIGVYGGRSAAVELFGALRAKADTGGPLPQYYGIDIAPAAMGRALASLAPHQLLDHALLYCGDLVRFRYDVPITPTMVFVDGDHSYPGAKADLDLLQTFLAPSTPVLCHDYSWIEGVQQAVREAVAGGHYELIGTFGASGLLRTTSRCTGQPVGLDPTVFAEVSQSIRDYYAKSDLASPDFNPAVTLANLTSPCRAPALDTTPWWRHAGRAVKRLLRQVGVPMGVRS